jgi:hypothetical protein
MKNRRMIYETVPSEGEPTGPFNKDSSVLGDTDILIMHPSGTVGLTALGGLAVKLTNKTNAASIKGMLVSAATSSSNAFQVISSDLDGIGYVYENAVAANSECWVVVAGIAQCLADGSSTSGDWVGSIGKGRVSASVGPTGLVSLVAETHFKETGHCIETTSSGSAKLITCVIHFN